MDNKILFYRLNGNIEEVKPLNADNLKSINGMMTRCTLKDGTKEIGFADPLRSHEKNSFDNMVHEYIYIYGRGIIWTKRLMN